MTAKSKTGNGGLKKFLAGSGSAGLGLGIAYFIGELIKSQPDVLTEIVKQGPLFLVAVVALFLWNNRNAKDIEAQVTLGVHVENLASAVKQIAEKDDRGRQEMQLTLGVVAVNTENLIKKFEEFTAEAAKQ